MPTEESLAEIETAELILFVDDSRAAGDPYKLQALLRTAVETRLGDLRTKDTATLIMEGGRAGASLRVRDALDALAGYHREGFNFINGLLSVSISKADKLELFIKYGWASGEIGTLDDTRTESLANLAATITPTVTNAAHRYPQALLDVIAAQLVIVNANQPSATGGTAQTATETRETAKDLLKTANGRVRFFYCSASDLEDQTTELARIGKQARRDRGEAGTQPLPDAPATATFDATAKTLSVPALPEGATTLRAYRKAAGGVAELAGTSTGTTVSVIALGPLTPGVTYELWVAGHNSQGDGPESNHVSHTAA